MSLLDWYELMSVHQEKTVEFSTFESKWSNRGIESRVESIDDVTYRWKHIFTLNGSDWNSAQKASHYDSRSPPSPVEFHLKFCRGKKHTHVMWLFPGRGSIGVDMLLPVSFLQNRVKSVWNETYVSFQFWWVKLSIDQAEQRIWRFYLFKLNLPVNSYDKCSLESIQEERHRITGLILYKR